jgi:hypothetical protein
MARLNSLNIGLDPVGSLEDLVAKLGQIKPSNDVITKEVKSLVDKIKEILIETNLTTYNSNGYRVTLQKKVQKGFNEPLLIEWAEQNNYDVVRWVQVIDEEALESAIYNGLIKPEDVIPFQTEKVTYSLITNKE